MPAQADGGRGAGRPSESPAATRFLRLGRKNVYEIGRRCQGGRSARCLPSMDVSRMDKPIDLLAEFGKFGLERRLSLRDPATISAFVGHVGDKVEGAVGDSPLLHGQRTEAMFEALMVSLGEFELLKGEDGGRLFPKDRYKIPDFRIVRKDGSHWLVEVKNVYEHEPFEQRRRLFTGSYLERLTVYADATGAELKIAVYWARWSIWTLVSPSRLIGPDGGLDLDMVTAIRVNELSRLGDRMIGTRSPLRLRLSMDEARTSPIEVTFTVGGVQIFCADQEIVEPAEQKIVWVFMQYGRWRPVEPEAILDSDRLLALEYRWDPLEPSNQGFEIVGTLSEMFAAHYAEQTIDSGKVVQIRAPLRPNWLEPLVSLNTTKRRLPLWTFAQEPNFEGLADE